MGNISKDKFIPLTQRVRQGTETSTVSYEDIGVSKGMTYNYAIDAFDRYGNRSALSDVQSITAGDITPPGPITATASISGYKSIEFNWQNPSDLDFTGCYIYSDLAKTNKIHELGGITPSSLTRKTFTTNTDAEEKNIYITTFDHNRNEVSLL